MSTFFAGRSEQSEVKALIVAKYFGAWAKVMLSASDSTDLAYVDLFSGPGRYDDGEPSTPLLVLERAIHDLELQKRLVTLFNDGNPDHARRLAVEISQFPRVDTLAHKPIVTSSDVGPELVEMLESTRMMPTFFFVDPWGYKGLSLRLVKAILKDWGCDCVFFFNFNRVNAGLQNELVREHMTALFGPEGVTRLESKLLGLTPDGREALIVEELITSLHSIGGRFVLPFRFLATGGRRTSHHLIFVTKHIRGYEIMKDIMYKASSTYDDGVASFEYSPVDDPQLRFLFEYSRPLDDLSAQLQSEFDGQQLSVQEIYERHHVGRPFVKANYKEALRRLEEVGKVVATPSASQRRKGTLADRVLIRFSTE